MDSTYFRVYGAWHPQAGGGNRKGLPKVNRKHGSNMLCLSGAIVFKFLKGEIYEAFPKSSKGIYQRERKSSSTIITPAVETSIMLKFYPELVDNCYKDLKPYLKNHLTKQVISENKIWQGYTAPAQGRYRVRRRIYRSFRGARRDLITRYMNGEDITRDVRSPFYSVPILHPRFKKYVAITAVTLVIIILLLLLLTQK
jgi:hypothetical protein